MMHYVKAITDFHQAFLFFTGEMKQEIQDLCGPLEWNVSDIKHVAEQICDRVQGLKLNTKPSLMKRVSFVNVGFEVKNYHLVFKNF